MAQKKRSSGNLPKEFSRHVALRKEDVQSETRTVAVSFSSETDKVRYFGRPQVLLHEPQAADFEGLRDAGSVLWNHNPDNVLGIPLDVTLDEQKRMGRASIRFDADPETDRIFQKVIGGSVRGVSVGFRVQDWEELEEGETWVSPAGRKFTGPADIATSWRAYEFSLTPIPADASVGVGRTQGPHQPVGDTMDLKRLREALAKRGLKAEATDEEVLAFAAKIAEEDQKRTEAQAKGPGDGDGEPEGKRAEAPKSPPPGPEAVRAERARVREIREMCSRFAPAAEIVEELCNSEATVEQARKAIIEKLGKEWPSRDSTRRVEVGEEERTKWARAAEDKLTLRTGWGQAAIKDEKRIAAASEVEGYRLVDLARESLRRAHIDSRRLSETEMISRAISHSTSDFPNILSNVANKALVKAYTEAPATWRPFVNVVSHSDFKARSINKLSDAGDLILTRELEPMPETSFSESVESYSMHSYSRRFGISRQAIINDDLSAFDRIPGMMGAAARRVPATLFYDLLVSAAGVGPTMAEDSLPLFSATHTSGSNYLAAAGAIAIATLSAAKALIRRQAAMVAAGETAPMLNLTPSYLLVPTALEAIALQFTTQIMPNASANVLPGWIPALQVVVEPRLDAATNGTTAWYLVVPNNQIASAEVAFLGGREEPTMVRVEGNNILGVEWGVYLDCGVKFIDHRGWFRQRGA